MTETDVSEETVLNENEGEAPATAEDHVGSAEAGPETT